MASKFDYLKPEAFVEYEKGLLPKDLLKLENFLDLPRPSAYRWYSEYQRTLVQNCTDTNTTGIGGIHPHSNVTPIGTREDSDFELVRKTLRSIIKGVTVEGAGVIVQACNTLLRAIEVKNSIKESEFDIPITDIDPSTLSDDELKAEIHKRRA